MKNRKKVLKEEDIRKIHKASLKILSDTGVHFWNSPEAIGILRKAECKVEDIRVF